MDALAHFAENAWSISLELAPWLLVGLLVAGLMHVLVPAGLFARHLRGPRGVVKAVAVGVPLPLCSCGVIPAGIGLKRDGASSGSAVGFLIATPQTGVDSVFVSASMLGWPFALLKVVAALVTGVIGGLLVDRGERRHGAPEAATPDTGSAHRRTLADGWRQGVDILRSIWGWLAVGILISAALTSFMPDNTLADLFGGNPLLGALAALLVSLPLYVCATGSVPIAAALVAAGLPIGAALVFLMAGPASNVATIGAIRRTFGGRTTALYLGTIIVGSLAFGLLFDVVLVDLVAGPPEHHHHAHSGIERMLEILSALILFAAMAYFIVEALQARARRPAAAPPFQRRVAVAGMTCQGCVRSLDKALRQLPGVKDVDVHLDGQYALLDLVDPDAPALPAAVEAAVSGAGFTFLGMAPHTPEPAHGEHVHGPGCSHGHHHHHH